MCAAQMELDTLQNMTNQEKLLTAFKQRNLDEFKEIIKCEDVDIDHIYVESGGTLLDLACQSSEANEYVLILLLNGASETKVKRTDNFERNSDETARHYLFVAHTFNMKMHKFCDTLIQTALEENDVNTMKLIGYYRSKNAAPESAHLLPLLESIEAVRILIEFFDVDMELRRDSHGHARTYRNIILKKYPKLKPELPTRSRSQSELQKILYSYLSNNAPYLFLNRIAELSTEFLDESFTIHDHNTYYFLHVACKKGYIDVVDALLEKNVQLNTLADRDHDIDVHCWQITPLAVAAYMGHYEIVTKLISHNAHLQIDEESGSVLTFVIHGMHIQGNSKDTHREILKLLLTYNSQTVPALDINHKDVFGKIPLHYAVAFKNEFVIKSLIDAGANWYSKDPNSSSPLTSVPATILEKFLDDSINLKTYLGIIGLAQAVTFDYSIFDQNDSTKGNEMEFFHQIQQIPELRTLLNHPLSESFLYVKWCLIKKYYLLNFAFYLLFCVALNAYIFQIYECSSSSTSYNSSQSTNTEINHQTSSTLCKAPWVGLGTITFLFYIVFIVRELCQIFLSIGQYFKSPENWLEMMMIAAVGVFFANERNVYIAATVNVMACIELVFLLGKHPWFSVYIEMFKTVALNFAKFLALFSILAVSFANSFYILFRNKTEEYASTDNETNVDPSNQPIENSINSWSDVRVSLIKSIIMMTGELDTSNLPLGENFNYSYVFFSLFIFLVPMVLYNLLNGLAISDTNAIMKDSEIVAVMSRVKLMWQLEGLLNSKSLQFLRKRSPEFLNHRFFRDVVMNSREHDDPEIQELERLSKRIGKRGVVVRSVDKYSIEIGNPGKVIGKMPLTIIKQAEQIVEKPNHSNSSKDMEQSLSTDVAKKTSSNSGFIDETVHKMSDQIHNLKLEIDQKNTEMKIIIDEMNAKITDRVEKLLQSVESNNKLLKSVVQADYLKPKEQVGDGDELLTCISHRM